MLSCDHEWYPNRETMSSRLLAGMGPRYFGLSYAPVQRSGCFALLKKRKLDVFLYFVSGKITEDTGRVPLEGWSPRLVL